MNVGKNIIANPYSLFRWLVIQSERVGGTLPVHPSHRSASKQKNCSRAKAHATSYTGNLRWSYGGNPLPPGTWDNLGGGYPHAWLIPTRSVRQYPTHGLDWQPPLHTTCYFSSRTDSVCLRSSCFVAARVARTYVRPVTASFFNFIDVTGRRSLALARCYFRAPPVDKQKLLRFFD